MRVVPELLDHPKFLKLKRRVGPLAAEFILRLWGHCESNQKGEVWSGANAEYVEIVAKFDGTTGELFKALVDCRLIDKMRGGVVIHDWNNCNSRAVNNWEQGKKGGRPKGTGSKKEENPVDNPVVRPMLNPQVELGLTAGLTPMSERVSEGMNEDSSLTLASQVEPAASSVSRSQKFLVDAHYLADLKKIFRPADIDRAYSRMLAWLKTPAGDKKAPTKKRFQTFLRDCEPLATVDPEEEKKKKAGPAGWREAWAEITDQPCPAEWADVFQTHREAVFEQLKKEKSGGEK